MRRAVKRGGSLIRQSCNNKLTLIELGIIVPTGSASIPRLSAIWKQVAFVQLRLTACRKNYCVHRVLVIERNCNHHLFYPTIHRRWDLCSISSRNLLLRNKRKNNVDPVNFSRVLRCRAQIRPAPSIAIIRNSRTTSQRSVLQKGTRLLRRGNQRYFPTSYLPIPF